MKTINLLLVAILALSLAGPAKAVPIIVVTPEFGAAEVGTEVDVLVSISNLTGEFIGAFDLGLSLDDSILAATDVFFGTGLDGPLDSIQGSFVGLGSVDAFEISLGFLAEQDGFSDFLLFGVTFDVIGAGITSLDPFVFAVGDFFGLPLEVGTQGATFAGIEVQQVPEPGTLALLTLGLLGLAVSRRRQSIRIK